MAYSSTGLPNKNLYRTDLSLVPKRTEVAYVCRQDAVRLTYEINKAIKESIPKNAKNVQVFTIESKVFLKYEY